jgi:hypothetical protein
MSKIVLHIGAGKTGSSALQHYLSFNGNISGEEKYKYCCLRPDGEVISGDELRSAASKSVIGYCSSTGEFDRISKGRFEDSIKSVWGEGYVPVLSQENWILNFNKIHSSNFLSIAEEVLVIGYFRPQVDWFNSGWWQWWEWDERFKEPVDVLNLWTSRIMFWGHHLRQWSQLANISKIHARLATSDIVGDFLGLLGASPSHSVEKINQGMNPKLIGLYRTIPGLRHPHGAELDVYLSRYLNDGEPTPWIVDMGLVERIIQECRISNDILWSFLDEKQKNEMRDDIRWWSSDVYKDKKVIDRNDLNIGIKDAGRIICNILLHALKRR